VPPGLYACVIALDQWVADHVADDPVLRGVIQACGFGPDEARQFKAGRAEVRSIVPPIGPTEIDDAELAPMGAACLGLAAVVRGTHVLHWARGREREPDIRRILREVGEVANLLTLRLEGHSGTSSGPAGRHLGELQTQLRAVGQEEAGKVNELRQDLERSLQAGETPELPAGLRAFSSPPAAVPSVAAGATRSHPAARATRSHPAARAPLPPGGRGTNPGAPAPTAIEPEAASPAPPARPRHRSGRIVWGIVLVLALAWWVAARFAGPPPVAPASDYDELPVVALIREEERVIVRVDLAWLAVPLAQREAAARALFERIRGEEGGDGIVILRLVTARGVPVGAVTAGGIRWEGSPEP
jgi:hypothetical protein